MQYLDQGLPLYRSLINTSDLRFNIAQTQRLIREDSRATIQCVKDSKMMGQLQDPQHVVPSIIVGLLLSSGWEVAYNDTQDPYIHHVTGQFGTYSTWWECLKAIIEIASNPE